MSNRIDAILYLLFYLFPVVMLIIGSKIKVAFNIFPFPIRIVDLITPYLLLSVAIQTKLTLTVPAHLYFYVALNGLGILHASYLAFVKRELRIGTFFRTWWRYTFILSFIYHLVIGGYGLYRNLL